MYVKLMQSIQKFHGVENDFHIMEIYKGQSIGFWQPPGKGYQMQVIENEAVVSSHPVNGPVYVMSEDGKTIATYGNCIGVELSGNIPAMV